MAGCFGNHPFDRHFEFQLIQHLNDEANYDGYCDALFEEFNEETFTYIEDVMNEADYKKGVPYRSNRWFEYCYNKNKTVEQAARLIEKIVKSRISKSNKKVNNYENN